MLGTRPPSDSSASTADTTGRVNYHLMRSYALLTCDQSDEGLEEADSAFLIAEARKIYYLQSKSQLYRGLCLMKLERWRDASAAFTRAANVRGWAQRVAELKMEAERKLIEVGIRRIKTDINQFPWSGSRFRSFVGEQLYNLRRLKAWSDQDGQMRLSSLSKVLFSLFISIRVVLRLCKSGLSLCYLSSLVTGSGEDRVLSFTEALRIIEVNSSPVLPSTPVKSVKISDLVEKYWSSNILNWLLENYTFNRNKTTIECPSGEERGKNTTPETHRIYQATAIIK